MDRKLECEKVENCFANARTYRYQWNEWVDGHMIERLEFFGSAFVKRNLRRPFFRIEMEGGGQIKGIFGESSIKVSYPEENWEEAKQRWEEQWALLWKKEDG